jgi:hypothetical protein
MTVWMIAAALLLETLQETDPHQYWPTKATVQVEEVAFWVYLEGEEAEELPVTIEEWDGYAAFLRQISRPKDEGAFALEVLRPILSVKVSQLTFAADIPAFVERLDKVVADLEGGMRFGRAVRRYTDDGNTRRMEGKLAEHSRMQLEYPMHWKLFDHAAGGWAGPFCTQFGAFFYWIQEKSGPNQLSPQQKILPQQLFVHYAPNSSIGSNQWSEIYRKIRVRIQDTRFARIIPPGTQVPRPRKFGPTDIAELGRPAQALTQFSESDELHGKVREGKRGGDQ